MQQEDWTTIMHELYPLTVTADRYNGTYSRGKFTAWNLDPEEVPTDINEDDMTCMDFWAECEYTVGLGRTVMEAIEDLERKLDENSTTSTTH